MRSVRDLIRAIGDAWNAARLKFSGTTRQFGKRWERRHMVLSMHAEAKAQAYAIRKRAQAEAAAQKILMVGQAQVLKQRAKRIRRKLRRARWQSVRANCTVGIRAVVRGAAAGFAAIGGGVAAQFRAIGHGAAGVVRAAAGGFGAGARGLAQVAAWPFRQLHRAGAAGRNWLANASLTNLFVLLAVVFAIAGLVGVGLGNAWIWTICLWLAFVSGRAANLDRRGLLRAKWKWAVYPRLSTIIVGSWLIFLIARIFGQ